MALTRVAIIGGTGIENTLFEDEALSAVESVDTDTPFGRPSGPIRTGTFGDVPIALLARHGAGHVRNPAAVPFRANIFALKALGCSHVIAFGATGSLQENVHPGDLVVCDQFIDRTDGRERTFYEACAVHVEFAEPCCPVMRGWLRDAATALRDTTVHDGGCYVCIEGPTFSTRAESKMHRQWGADVVGMTALPEARLAREAELAYTMVALPTDYDCWRPRAEGEQDSIMESVLANLGRASDAAGRLLRRALGDVSVLRETASPAHDALATAIWTDRSKLNPVEIEQLEPLWGRHLSREAAT